MSAISNYQSAIEQLTTAKAEADKMVKIIRQGTEALRDWRKTMVSDSGGFPLEIGLSRSSPVVSGREWPDSKRIAGVLQAYHKAKHEFDNAFQQTPENERSVVKRPNEYY